MGIERQIIMDTIKRKKVNSLKIFTTPVLVDEKYITIKLPVKMAEYIKIHNNKAFWVPVNGSIQICGTQPKIVIPAMDLSVEHFLARK